jgi:hypothetical protein
VVGTVSWGSTSEAPSVVSWGSTSVAPSVVSWGSASVTFSVVGLVTVVVAKVGLVTVVVATVGLGIAAMSPGFVSIIQNNGIEKNTQNFKFCCGNFPTVIFIGILFGATSLITPNKIPISNFNCEFLTEF